MPPKGTPQLPIRLNEADREALKRVTNYYGYRDAASLIRWLIHREDRAISGATPKAEQPPEQSASDDWTNLPPDED